MCFLRHQPFPDQRFIRKEVYYHGEQKTRPFCLSCHAKVKGMVCHSCHHPMGVVVGVVVSE